MPWITQMIYFALLFTGIAVALWMSIWILLALLVIGIIAVVWGHLKAFLIGKGILNPTPGIPPGGIIIEQEEVDQPITLIEGEYTRVDKE